MQASSSFSNQQQTPFHKEHNLKNTTDLKYKLSLLLSTVTKCLSSQPQSSQKAHIPHNLGSCLNLYTAETTSLVQLTIYYPFRKPAEVKL